MFNDLQSGKYIILSVNSIILLILIFWLYRNNSLYLSWAIGLIVGGAIGNMIDRVINSAVADFLDFYIGNYHWPAFNVADSCVFIGVFLLLFENYFVKKSPENKSLKNEK
jgi:signal peptidase II